MDEEILAHISWGIPLEGMKSYYWQQNGPIRDHDAG